MIAIPVTRWVAGNDVGVAVTGTGYGVSTDAWVGDELRRQGNFYVGKTSNVYSVSMQECRIIF